MLCCDLQIAHMLYLESPAGTGFSYSEDRNYTSNDSMVNNNRMHYSTFGHNYTMASLCMHNGMTLGAKVIHPTLIKS